MLLSFPCRDEKCRQADAKREQRRQLLEALPIPNVSVVVDFQVNLNDSENASHAARLLNTSGKSFVVDFLQVIHAYTLWILLL